MPPTYLRDPGDEARGDRYTRGFEWIPDRFDLIPFNDLRVISANLNE